MGRCTATISVFIFLFVSLFSLPAFALSGDYNCDGEHDILDLIKQVSDILNNDSSDCHDQNNDGYNDVSYDAGVDAGAASVDTDSAYMEGFNDGVASVDTQICYEQGFEEGVASVDVQPYLDALGECCGDALDADSDGLLDFQDNCPTVYNDGQEDTDGDNIGDACECLNHPGCPAQGPCQGEGTCDSQTGECVVSVLDDGSPCAAGGESADPCAPGGMCQSGQCVSAPEVVYEGGLHIYNAADAAAAAQYTRVTDQIYMDNTNVSSLVLPNLRCVGTYLYLTNNHQLEVLSMPNLVQVGGEKPCEYEWDCDCCGNSCNDGLCVNNDTGETWTPAEGYLYMTGNTKLPTFDFSALRFAGDYGYSAGNDSLPKACVQDLIDQLANAGWTSSFTNSGGTDEPCPGLPDLDGDGDGVDVPTDNCPTVSNEDQQDTDGDLIGDACECLNVSSCPPEHDCQAEGACDPTTGQCVHDFLANGTGCDDSNDCTQTDQCQEGVCTGANPIADDGVACGPVSCPQTYCDAGQGTCSLPAPGSGESVHHGGLSIHNASDAAQAVQYTAITGNIYMDNTNVAALVLPNLRCVGEYLYLTNNAQLEVLSMPNLESVGSEKGCDGDWDCDCCDQFCNSDGLCVKEDGQAYMSTDGYLYMTGNMNLPTFDFSSLAFAGDYGYSTGNSALPTSCVDALITQLADAGWTNSFTNSGGADGSCPGPPNLDDDGDGVPVPIDNCPTVSNADQTDTDGDLIGDACECINVLSCPAQHDCQADGACDPTTGQCVNPSLDDGTGCDDGNDCTQTDQCASGSCTGSNPVEDTGVMCGNLGCPQTYCVPGEGSCEMLPDHDNRLYGSIYNPSSDDMVASDYAHVTEVVGDIYIDNMDDLVNLDLPNLTCVKGNAYITNNDSLQTINAPNLVSVGHYKPCDGQWDCDCCDNTCNDGVCSDPDGNSWIPAEGYLYMTGNQSLQGFDFSALQSAGDYGYSDGNSMLPSQCVSELSEQLYDAGWTGSYFHNGGGADGPCL